MSTSAAQELKLEASKDEKNLVVSFIRFLRDKMSKMADNEKVDLEMTVAWLQHQFGITDIDYSFQADKTLLDVFVAAEGHSDQVSPADIALANKLKEEGNELIKQGHIEEGIAKYNEAIKLHRDPIYFCNRAAVYCRLEKYDLAIQDCRTALALDPKYAKAYGRLGVAFSAQNKFGLAVDACEKALELEPNNDAYKQNLDVMKIKKREAEAAAAASSPDRDGGFDLASMFNIAGGAGGIDLAGVLNNPAVMQMASQVFNDPELRNTMNQMFGSMNPGAQGGAVGSMDELLRMGQMMAQQVNQNSPDLVGQLRNAMNPGANSNVAQPPTGANVQDQSGNRIDESEKKDSADDKKKDPADNTKNDSSDDKKE